MVSNPCIEIHTTPEERPSVPPWFAEVVIVAGHLTKIGLLETFAQKIRLVRGRFGRYEPIDFLAALLGYAISGERTLADFFERIAPFETAFMALFGRAELPHRSSLSRFLASVDRECLEVLRTLFQQHALAEEWTQETIGGIWDRQKRRYIVFDVDATRQAARQRSLPCGPELPEARRRLDEVCAPGYTGRKRGEVVRSRTTVLQMHTRQWVGTYGNRGNGDYRGELTLALQAITTYLKLFAIAPEMALVRLDGLYGDVAVVAKIIQAGMFFVTRGRGYHLLNSPQIQAVLTWRPSERMIKRNTDEIFELFDGGWLPQGAGLPPVRVIVARHPAPPLNQKIKVGKRVGEWVYELFLTNLDPFAFLLEDILDLYYGRGAFEGVLADEDVEQDPDRWCSYTECGQEFWQIISQWAWNVRLTFGHQMQEQPMRQMEWSLPKALLEHLQADPTTFPLYDSWKVARGGPRRKFPHRSFLLQDDETLRCPEGKILRLSLRQRWIADNERAYYNERGYYRAELADCQTCTLREQCLPNGSSVEEARRVYTIRHQVGVQSVVERALRWWGTIEWKDVAGRSLRRTWIAHWRRQYVEVLALVPTQQRGSPPPREDRAVRSHSRMSWQDRLARNAWWGPPHFRVTVAGVPTTLAAS